MQVVFLFLTGLLIIFEGIYWYHDHMYLGSVEPFNHTADKVHRGSGELAVILLSLMLITSTKDSIFNNLLELSHERGIQLHRMLA